MKEARKTFSYPVHRLLNVHTKAWHALLIPTGKSLIWCQASSLGPRGGECLLTQLRAHGSNRALIGGTLERWDGRTNGFTQGFCCSPQLCSPQGTLCRCSSRFLCRYQFRHCFQAGSKQFPIAQLFRYCQTLIAEHACRRIVTPHSSYPG